MAHDGTGVPQEATPHSPRASDSASNSLVLLALATGGFAIGTTEFAAMGLLPYFSQDLGIEEATAGHVISAYALGVVVGAPIISVLAARFERRVLLIGLMIVFAVANTLSALSPSYEWMLLFRFLSGLPHGAYFGVASLMAASLVPENRRTQAVARMMLGLTLSTVVGVPLANTIGQTFGWRWGFSIVAVLALLTACLVCAFAPRQRLTSAVTPLQELGALTRPQVWLTLGIGAIGFGGMFTVYTYLASTLIEVTHAPPAMVSVALGIFGLGMTIGTLVCAWLADKALMPTIGGVLLWSIVVLAIYPLSVGSLWTILPAVFFVGCGAGLTTPLQTRLMDIAGDSQELAAALNHSAFNIANALGPWLGGLAIAAGFGWQSTGLVGSALAVGGALLWLASLALMQAQARPGTKRPSNG